MESSSVVHDIHNVFHPSIYNNRMSNRAAFMDEIMLKLIPVKKNQERYSLNNINIDRYGTIQRFCGNMKLLLMTLSRHYYDSNDLDSFTECMDCSVQWNHIEKDLPIQLTGLTNENYDALFNICQCMYVFWHDVSIWISFHLDYKPMIHSMDEWNVPIQNEYIISFQNMMTSIPPDQSKEIFELINLSRLFFLWKGFQIHHTLTPQQEAGNIDLDNITETLSSGFDKIFSKMPMNPAMKEKMELIRPELNNIIGGLTSGLSASQQASLNPASNTLFDGIINRAMGKK